MRGRLTRESLERHVWETMDLLRGALPTHEYKDYVAALLFLKWLSDRFEENRAEESVSEIRASGQASELYVPKRARWEELKRSADSGAALDLAMASIQQENAELDGIFWGVEFSRLESGLLRRLLHFFSAIDLRASNLARPDVPGEVFERMFQRAAAAEGRSLGGFASPPEVGDLLVRLVDPRPGMTVYDPACGIGSLLTRSAKHVEAVSPRERLTLVGREKNVAVWARCRMNMFLHGLPQARIEMGDSLRDPEIARENRSLRMDRVLAHPPFAARGWSEGLSEGELLGRFPFDAPPRSSGDYAWIQHAYSALGAGGVAGVLMPRGVLFRVGSEGRIRRRMLEEGVIEAVVTLPPKLIYGTPTPAVILLLRRRATAVRNSPVFFLDVTGEPEGAAPGALAIERSQALADIYHRREEIPGVSRAVPLKEIAAGNYILSADLYLRSGSNADPLKVEAARRQIRLLERRRHVLGKRMDRVLDEIVSSNSTEPLEALPE